MSLFMGTTKIAAEKTAHEISEKLAHAGASQILQRYEGGKVVGLSFSLELKNGTAAFKLPVRVEPIFRILTEQRAVSVRGARAGEDRAQAERVAWRQILRWIESQVALIQVGMVETAEVFLPYMVVSGKGTTLYERALEAGEMKFLEAVKAGG